MVGWVGHGLLDVNVPGPVFSAPGPGPIVAGIKAADRGAGVLLLVSSHAGDIMNGILAISDASSAGLTAEMVVVYDDVASGPAERPTSRRGGAGLFFVWKIVGALAERGGSLAECVAMAERVRDGTRSIAAAIGTIAHPVTGEPLGSARADTFSIGMGVHGEGGMPVAADTSADTIAELAIARLVDDLAPAEGSRVGLIVNNSGSLTLMELSILYRGAQTALEKRRVEVARSWIGSYATTFDLAGFAFAISALDQELESLYDDAAHGAGFVTVGHVS
jgi:dihydroxyacetone kinase